jgi:hypothetical protein
VEASEHHAYLFANLVYENHAGLRARDYGCQLSESLRHQSRLKSGERISHLAVEFRAGNERGDRIDYKHVDTVRTDEGFGYLKRLLARIGLRDEKIIDVHSQLYGVFGIHRVFGVYISGHAALFLRLGDYVKRESRFAARFRAVDFYYAPARNSAHAYGGVEAQAGSRDGRDIYDSPLAQSHDGTFAELFFYVGYRRVYRFISLCSFVSHVSHPFIGEGEKSKADYSTHNGGFLIIA